MYSDKGEITALAYQASHSVKAFKTMSRPDRSYRQNLTSSILIGLCTNGSPD